MKSVFQKCTGIFCMAVLLAVLILPLSVRADSGPKPSVVIAFEELDAETCYVTLLSKEASTGPWSAGKEYEEGYGNQEIWEKFHHYSDTDGFFFLGYLRECAKSDKFVWSYYPPDTFKILIYIPKQDKFIVSDIYERYAFDSYFTMKVNQNEVNQGHGGDSITVEPSYDYFRESISLLCRIVITIMLELGVAWLFGFRSKKQVLVIAGVNLLTQTVLNVLWNLIYYASGGYAFVFHSIWLEILVFLIEGIAYAVVWESFLHSGKGRRRLWIYALIANAASFGAGLILANILPGIF